MPSFHDSTTSDAPPEEVWKLLYDPSRFLDWWADTGIVAVEDDEAEAALADRALDFPMQDLLETHRDGQRVTVSCIVADLRFEWKLEPAGDGTHISVDAELPDANVSQLDEQRRVVGVSLRRLAELAAHASG